MDSKFKFVTITQFFAFGVTKMFDLRFAYKPFPFCVLYKASTLLWIFLKFSFSGIFSDAFLMQISKCTYINIMENNVFLSLDWKTSFFLRFFPLLRWEFYIQAKNIPVVLPNSPIKVRGTLLYAEFISAWSNQGSFMCLLSILNQ